MTTPSLSMPDYRALAERFLLLAVNGEAGRTEQDPVYRAITEGRDFGAGYSSCGDLCHWLLFRLGVREAWLNRAEHNGWRQGKNIGRLMWSSHVARAPRQDELYEAGDILAVWNQPEGNDAHVLVALRDYQGCIESADYGQPGGAIRRRTRKGGMLGDRKLQRMLPLQAVLELAARAGRLVEPDDPATWLRTVEGAGNVA